jgi:carboxymethylenebutenolidase
MRIQLSTGTPAELALPIHGGPSQHPARGLVLAPDIMGLRPLFDAMCARLSADHNWAICAPEPFPGREHLPIEERQAAMGKLEDDRQIGDLVAAADVLVERAGVGKIAVLGFCMGGMYALKASSTGRFDRAVAFYGMIRVPSDWRGPDHAEPLDDVDRAGDCQVLAIVGEQDPYTPMEDVEALDALPNVTVVRYPEAEHGFVHDPGRPAHRADDAADAWRRAIEFLAAS